MDHDLSRRNFMKGAAGLGALTILGLTGGCEIFEATTKRIQNRPIRRNISSLAANDPIIQTYKDAVAKMKALPMSDPRNWTKQAQIHLNHCPHNNWFFLPWHRGYLYYFEEICRELTGNDSFALPYWNWTTNRSIPDPFWGAGNPLNNTTRVATQTSQAQLSAVGPTVLENILNEPNFLIFGSGQATSQRQSSVTGVLEGTPHNYIHGVVGGDMGNYLSPLDPVFWTHHNMIECCWVNWNLTRSHPNTNDPQWTGFTFSPDFVDRNGNPVTLKVSDTFLYPIFLYRFEECFPVRGARERSSTELEEFAKRGARVKLDFLDRVEVQDELTLDVGRPMTREIPMKADLFRSALTTDQANRLLLTVGAVKPPVQSDVFVRVFVNMPDATPETPVDDPHYAGSFAFFESDHDDQHGSGSRQFIVDMTETVRRLRPKGAFRDSSRVDVQLVAVPFPDREPKAATVRIERLMLGISAPLQLE